MHVEPTKSIVSRSLLSLLCLSGIGVFGACGGGDDGDDGDAGNQSFITISEVAPDHGPQSGGTIVRVTGSGFTLAGAERNRVLVGDTLADAVSVISDTTIEVVVPSASAAGPVAITVFNGNGSAALGDVFSYNEAPTLDALAPEDSDVQGGETITLSGSGFTALEAGTNHVFFDGVESSEVSPVDDGTVTVVTPPGFLGRSTKVRLENNNGRTDSLSFRYRSNGLLAFGHSRRNIGFVGAAAVAGNDGEMFFIDPVLKTIEATDVAVVGPDNSGLPVCRGVGHDDSGLYAQIQEGGVAKLSFEDGSTEVITPLSGCSRVHAITAHQGDLYAYCRENPDGQAFGKIDIDTRTFTPVGNLSGGFRTNLVSDGTTMYLVIDSQISTINGNTGVRGPVVSFNGVSQVRGLAFSDGILYGLSTSFSGGGGGGPDGTFLHTINPNTGNADFVMTLGTGLRGLASAR